MNRAMRRAEASMQRKQKHRPSRQIEKHLRNPALFEMLDEKPKVDRSQLGKFFLYFNLGQGFMCQVSEKLWELLNNRGNGLEIVKLLCPIVWVEMKSMEVAQLETFPATYFPSLHGVVMYFCKENDRFMVGLEKFIQYPSCSRTEHNP